MYQKATQKEKGSPRYVSPSKLSERIGIPIQSLANDRHNRRGFPYIKLGKKVLYDWEEVQAIMKANTIRPER